MKIINSSGLSFDFLENGAIGSIQAGPVRIGLQPATPFSKQGTNLYLRKRTKPFEFIALTGPESNSRFEAGEGSFRAAGSWAGLEYDCMLQLSEKSMSWQWVVDIRNHSGEEVELDLIYLQDAGLKPATSGLMNEYYVSQYLERRILEDDKYGSVICCRQNMTESTGNPWLMLACRNGSVSACVDGMQFYGKVCRESGIPEGLLTDRLGGECAGESSVMALQERPFKLADGEYHKSVFVATFLHDHRLATSEDDLDRLTDLMLEFTGEISFQDHANLVTPVRNLFNTSPFLPVDDLNDADLDRFFEKPRRHCETDKGRLLSFFCGKDSHVVLHPKEMMVDRPHGQIMQANAALIPDESIMSVTSFAYGVFNSHLTQGNTNFNILLSVCSSPFNLARETGQRIFVEADGQMYLLGVPSAFEAGLNHCRWIYKYGNSTFQVRTWTSVKAPRVNLDFRVLSGKSVRLIITHHFDDAGGWKVIPGSNAGEFIAKPGKDRMISGKFPGAQFRIKVNSPGTPYRSCSDEALYEDKKHHGSQLFVLDVHETSAFYMSFIGEVCAPYPEGIIEDADLLWLSDHRDSLAFWQELSLNLSLEGDNEDLAAIREILPWYGMNALTHFLMPYGLEQFSGAAWGTRDIAQGPFDLLLCTEKYDEARKVLLIIFSNQDPDGGWPQWWMFDSYSNIRADGSHGDLYYWCMIALSNYIKVTGDLSILDEVLPYYNKDGATHAEKTPVSEHIDRLIHKIIDSFIPGTSLVPFGGGDWNDSLQPVSKDLAQRMISSWTVEMNYQAFDQYRHIFELAGDSRKAADLKTICDRIKADFNQYLIREGVVAGYGITEKDGNIGILLHPDDALTGVHYSILPMERGILSDIFTKEQARHHLDLIEQHLKGPDGARLMDRPLTYKGGIQTLFQRAESSTFFGREIGLMYVHEHIRYAESLARTGKADAFLKALRQAIPVGYREVVPCGDFRQANCYYSSSDVTFRSRYEADELYDKIKTGEMTLKGGWRVYSSGPGIYFGLIVSKLLGLRVEFGNIIIDPVIPFSFNGLSASMNLMGHAVTFHFSVKDNCYSPNSLSINGKPVHFTYEENKYREGGAIIPMERFLEMLDKKENIIDVFL